MKLLHGNEVSYPMEVCGGGRSSLRSRLAYDLAQAHETKSYSEMLKFGI